MIGHSDQIATTIVSRSSQPCSASVAEGLLHQVLPLDPERCAEMRVWLAFTTRALVDRRMRELRDGIRVGVTRSHASCE